MLGEAWGAGARLGQPELRKDVRPFFEYGMFALWNNGARTVAKNLDFVMVGALLGLAAVPRYTFAFFIATVVSMPLRAMSPILRSLTSKAVAAQGAEQSGPQLQQAARVQLAVTAAILVAILAGMPALDLALPGNYQGLRWVVLAVGMAFVAEASGGTFVSSSSKGFSPAAGTTGLTAHNVYLIAFILSYKFSYVLKVYCCGNCIILFLSLKISHSLYT